MAQGSVAAIFICPVAGGPMQEVKQVEAIARAGLKGDRYCTGKGSFSEGTVGKRQVSLINGIFFQERYFEFADTRRNIVTFDVELMWLVNREFQIGAVRMRGLKYCDPCERVDKLSGKKGFKDAFFDRGGLIAEILEGGIIEVGAAVITPKKGY